MSTLDLNGLSERQVHFLQRLVASWKRRNPGPEPHQGSGVGKIRKEDLPPLPAWWEQTLQRVKDSPLAAMSEEEVGQLCEQLAEEALREDSSSAPKAN
ncbi:MAG: hypothetical protein HYW07_15035 [Candidatus Latescibacteria bacterium]|nr:hypothetical protein [Candidatus Latescibacterota bacterium]